MFYHRLLRYFWRFDPTRPSVEPLINFQSIGNESPKDTGGGTDQIMTDTDTTKNMDDLLEQVLFVPDDDKFNSLIESAKNQNYKNVAIPETIRFRYRRSVKNLIKEIHEDSTIENTHLYLKCLVLQSLKELIQLHAEVARSYADQHVEDAQTNWAKDEGRLVAASDLIYPVIVGNEDWMAFGS